jgi:hypothetical protein
MHWPAMNMDMNVIASFRSASYVKKHGVGVRKEDMMSVEPSVEQRAA